MLQKLNRFSEALQKRNPDDNLVDFFNDMYEEAQSNERYVQDLEYTNLSMQLNPTVRLLADCHRLRKSAERTIKVLISIRR